MLKTWAIFKKEFKTYFISPIAYVVAGAFLVLTALIFNKIVEVKWAVMFHILGNMSVYLMFIVPFLTMRLLAEERKRQSIALLFTSPVSNSSIVVGKFLACYAFVLLMLAVTLVYPNILAQYGDLDMGPVKSGYLGLALLAGCYVGIGLFASSISGDQVIAGVLGVGFIIFFYLIEMAKAYLGETGGVVVEYLSIYRPQQDFLQGLINTKDLFFYISFIFITLFASVRMLDANRWR